MGKLPIPFGTAARTVENVSEPNVPRSYLAEWYWPGVGEETLAARLARAEAVASQLRREGRHVSFRGSILVRGDETVFCLFDGLEADIRAAGELSGTPFERVLESLWLDASTKEEQ